MGGALLRVSVCSAHRRVDLVLPGSIPVAELLPELARSVGLLDPATVHLGHRLRLGGRELSSEHGLGHQGVVDGALLVVTAGSETAPVVHDDVAEALTEAVQRGRTTVSPVAARLVVAASGALLVVLGWVALAVGHRSLAVPMTALLVVAALAGSVLPRLALGVTGTRADELLEPAGAPVDRARVDADARLARRVLVATSAAAGAMVTAAAPFAVGLGRSGSLLAVVASLVVGFRARGHRDAWPAGVHLAAGTSALLASTVAVLCVHPGWRGFCAAGLLSGGAVVLVAPRPARRPSPRRGQLLDMAEAGCLLALLPLLALAVGLPDVVA